MRLLALLVVSVTLTALVVAGCAKTPEPKVTATTPATNPEPQAPAEPASTEQVRLDVMDWETTRALVQHHSGKVVIMDLWATYCPPCMAEFPNLVHLHRTYPGRVACISVSTDYDGLDEKPVEAHRERVMKFLTKQQATFQNILLSTDTETLFAQKVTQQSIPIVFVFDRQGQLQGEFPDPKNPDEFTYRTHIFPLVEKLLAAP
ncbi:TlpA family protein disulfide reductase [Planctomicrobium piriforme]|uniref:Thiol-disulfide isomerase or thioredoxin n=1 Tax=Planctomicrobium piriforme TaxID=1576369 RepID=A0A1I3E4X4_9PLAN|nr:TlpA disulfide reductase family protein [Planctomicrobium piriforme]SFH93863.1 Thiol-disulfide isomerase or thioredoxin [Planctomicrobium piriforme]